MSAKLLINLNETEKNIFLNSDLFIKSKETYRYSKNSLKYYLEYYNHEYENYSIIVFNSKSEPILLMYAYSKLPIYSHFGEAIEIIEKKTNCEELNNAYKKLFIFLYQFFREKKINQFLYLNNDFILSDQFSKTTESEIIFNSYINLELSEENIKSNIRKSYKSLVNWGINNLKMVLIDSKNLDYAKFLEFREFHIKIAGRKTRSDESWEIQYDAIKENISFLTLGYLNDELVSGSLILFGETEAYYGVGVYNRELMSQNIAIGHYNILFSIYESKKRGLKTFNLGCISEISNDDKSKNIFKFKTGFANNIKATLQFKSRIIQE